jgi:hypothetical protein
MKWWVAVVAIAGCKSGSADHLKACRVALDTAPAAVAHGRVGGLKACAPLFVQGCADALTSAEDRPTPATLPRVMKACATAYPKVDATLAPTEFFASALVGTKDLKEHEGDAIGSLLLSELKPPGVPIHITPDSITIEHGATFPVSAEPTPEELKPAVDAMNSAGAKLGGVWIWGRDDAPKVFIAVVDALGDTPYRPCLRDGSNCQQ